MSNGPDLLKEYAAFFAGFDPYLEARNIIQNGDTHLLGIQRAQSHRHGGESGGPHPPLERLLYPHLTTAYLRNIVAGKAQREDRTLAAEELKRRGL
ncbi:MAG: hypothetical protein MO853_01250 [Candidatus Protistobacter heckmanni]|nr:hypothetical protein [Candidatus Protistobacter heckmanni]